MATTSPLLGSAAAVFAEECIWRRERANWRDGIQVRVLDVFRDIALMVRSEPFVEYLHLARFGDRWLIVNALYFVLAGL